MQVTMPSNTPFIELARFAHSIGCDLITRSPTQIELRPSPEAQAQAQALTRALERAEPRRA